MAEQPHNNDNSWEGDSLLGEFLKKSEQAKKSAQEEFGNDQSFVQAIENERTKMQSGIDLDDSGNLIRGLDDENDEKSDFEALDYPFLKLYGGENGTFELIEKGKKKVKKITDDRYPLPLDTDIVKLNAYRISTGGDWEKVTSIGNFVINATRVEFANCYDLEKLPPMNAVQSLDISYCYELRFLDPLTRVKELKINHSSIQFLPKSLAVSEIKLNKCMGLQYIHPAIPIDSISGMKEKEIKACKIRYMLSEHVSDQEKSLYPIMEKNILINNPKLRTLPACFNGPNITLEKCDKLEFIHPSINPKKIKGMSEKDIYHCQMMYLFKKMRDDDPSFDLWFQQVKKNFSRTRE